MCETQLFDEQDEGLPDKIYEILLNTQEQCQMMDNLIRNQIQVKDAMIDKLHSELEYYKTDSADRFISQVMKSVIKLRRDMLKRMGSSGWSQMTADDLRREFTYVFEDVTDLLEQQGIDAYVTKPGELFDAAVHQAKVEIVSDPSLDKMVKCSLSEGYRKGDKVLIPERVVVCQYRG